MTVEKVICDECGRVKAEANHWHQMCVYQGPAPGQTLVLGDLSGWDRTPFEIHDLCGQECLYKHIGKLLKLNPVTEGV